MKKDKKKYQPISELTITDGLKSSSASITLQLLAKEKEKIKEEEKKEAAAEAAKVRCRTCFKEIAPTRRCFGHGGGSGGSDSGSDKTFEETASPGEDKSLTKSGKVVESSDELGAFASMEDTEELDSDPCFDPKIIAKLIAEGRLLVKSDPKSLSLTLELLCDPNALTEEEREELKKFMGAIIKEFNAFKEENHLSDDCLQMIQDEQRNILSLRITMPTSPLYLAFIQRLENNLVPIPNPELQEKDEARKSQSVAPNPFSMESKPSNKNKSSKREEVEHNKDIEPKKTEDRNEEQKIFNPSPFNMKPW